MAADASAAQMPAAEGQQEPAAAAGAGMLGMHMPPTGVFAKDFEVPISYMGSSSGQFSIVNVIGQVNGVLRDVQELRSCLRLSARHAFGALDEGEPAVPARAQVPLTMKRASTDQRPGESPSAKSAKSAAPGESPSAKSAKSAAMTEKDEAVGISADCKLGIQASFKQIQANKRSKEKKAHARHAGCQENVYPNGPTLRCAGE